ncbi:MAG: hypothetical protein U0932_17550 [Thiobacillus sp.]|nr:hypothetical protein [Thiobacillus sp.]
MTETSKLIQLVQQHILEHESRLKHVDELLERARKDFAQAGGGDTDEELAGLKLERDQLSSRVEAFKLKPPEQWSSTEEFEKNRPHGHLGCAGPATGKTDRAHRTLSRRLGIADQTERRLTARWLEA